MSLAIYAAPFSEENEETNRSNSLITKKKQNKKVGKSNEKVNSMLKEIHNQTDESDNDMGDFNPPPKPESAGVERTNDQEEKNLTVDFVRKNEPKPMDVDDNVNKQSYVSNDLKMKNVDDYYKLYVPDQKANYYNMQNLNQTNDNNVLMQKLNYMISLLEEQHDQRTNNITEEVILYSFLGIFMIFICDSFVRVGKYVR